MSCPRALTTSRALPTAPPTTPRRALTRSLGEQTAGAAGTLSFDVKVSAEAAVVDDIANTATVEVGENESQTNTTHNSVPREGSLTVKKTVVGGDSQREFGFTVALADRDGEPVSGTFGKGDGAVTFTDGKATFALKDGEGEGNRRPARGRELHRDRGCGRGLYDCCRGGRRRRDRGRRARGVHQHVRNGRRGQRRSPPRGSSPRRSRAATGPRATASSSRLRARAAPHARGLCRRLQDRQRDGRRRHQGGR